MVFPIDIEHKIKTDFKAQEIETVKALLKKMIEGGLNVGNNQFARSVIFLANKDLEKLKKIILAAHDDPRDVISEAELKSGAFEHWFAIPFDEIEQLNGTCYNGDIFKQKKEEEDNGLPF